MEQQQSLLWLVHPQTWVPVLLLAVVVLNRYWLKWRWPSTKETFTLLGSVATIIAAGQVWWKASHMNSDPEAWAMMLGCLLMFWLAADAAWITMNALRTEKGDVAAERLGQ